jgi:2-oxoglutarate ferredoxin oxidoreductase subunit beta
VVQRLSAHGEVATGLIYFDPAATDLHRALKTSATPLNRLDEKALCPGSSALEKLNAGLR